MRRRLALALVITLATMSSFVASPSVALATHGSPYHCTVWVQADNPVIVQGRVYGDAFQTCNQDGLSWLAKQAVNVTIQVKRWQFFWYYWDEYNWTNNPYEYQFTAQAHTSYACESGTKTYRVKATGSFHDPQFNQFYFQDVFSVERDFTC